MPWVMLCAAEAFCFAFISVAADSVLSSGLTSGTATAATMSKPEDDGQQGGDQHQEVPALCLRW